METLKEIPFKVYTFWNVNEKPEVRRFGVLKNNVDSFFFLSQKLLEVYPGLKDKHYTVSWKDEDGDDVVISSDMELKTALQYMKYDNLKLYIHCKGETKKNTSNIFTNPNAPGCSTRMPTGIPRVLHLGVVCDSCDSGIVGFRYKCTVCDDFDLCSQCEAAGCHPEHCMVRVPTPTMPRTLIKAAIKRSRHFLKSVSSNVGEECPYMKRRRDKSGERKHRGHHGGHHGPHSPHGPHGGDAHRRTRTSWLETFATYMNEFANLAGDIDLSDDKSKAPETKPEEQKPQATQEEVKKTTSESAQAPKEPEPSTSENAEAEYPVLPPGIDVENIKGLLKMFLHDCIQHPTSSSDNDVEMGQGDRKTSEADNVTVNSEPSMKSATSGKAASVMSEASADSSINTEFYKDSSPDKADDWTMINKEKDLIDVGSTGPTEEARPIGFNLPEEFQERVKINDGGSLYPPLNTSTAVPEMRPEAPPSAPAPGPEGAAAAAPPAPQPTPQPTPQQAPQPAPQPQPQPQPRQRHPKPHIEAAIQHMMKMGFSNDGDWLTQLLEYTDGNIAAVLDLLTPVNPKK